MEVVINQGLDADTAIKMMEMVAKRNMLEMQGYAQELVDQRVSWLNDQIFEKLREAPELINTLQDPDIQSTLYAAQNVFAKNGSEELGRSLIDMLVDRFANETMSLTAIVLNEAIATIGRLTPLQINTLTAVFVSTRIRSVTAATPGMIFSWLRENLVPVAAHVATHGADYEHLAYTGCASIEVTSSTFGSLLSGTYPGLFPRGFSELELPLELQGKPELFMPCINDSTKLQLKFRDSDAVVSSMVQDGYVPVAVEQAKTLLKTFVQPANEIEDAVKRNVPELEAFVNLWPSTLMNQIRLTSVGLALAHAHWRQQCGGVTDLSVWIPNTK
ncbi:hypothetical protein GCM10009789_19340 [Kribbella sancticallisti]|uniref:Uncharacterized protein n=1 Tax=Kribbella sancticallisti TaxID=460087 RepID=A0ABN2CZZ9_9ACTN